jgi:site-specific recombinase XerD
MATEGSTEWSKAAIDTPTKGASLLRHSAATAMLRGGATLDMVGAVLRHRSPDMTAHYAKVDVTMLRQIAQPWPGGAGC